MALGFLLAAEGVVRRHGSDPAPNLALSLSKHQSTGFIHNITHPLTHVHTTQRLSGSEETRRETPGCSAPPPRASPRLGTGRTAQGCEAQVEIVERAVAA